MTLQFITLDVFTSTPFLGNALAIIHVPKETQLTQTQKQAIATEFHLAESVFLHEQNETDANNGDFRIDIFTAFAEIPFAGHPTIGTSNYLLRYLNKKDTVALQTKAGRIPIVLDGENVKIDVAHNVHIHDHPFASTDYGHYPVVSIVKGMTFIMAGLESLQDLAKCTQNLLGPERTYQSQHVLDDGWREGIVATYYFKDIGEEAGVRLVRTRMFGSSEDAATGSAASALCSWLSLTEKGSRTRRYHVRQGVEMGRQSDIYVEVTLDQRGEGIEKVVLSGTAVKVMDGSLIVP